MTQVKPLAWLLALTLALAGGAVAMPANAPADLRLPTQSPALTPPVIEVQQGNIPDVVQLLAQRAVRAERRGDMDTANELYGIIRDMGYVVRRPEPGGEGRGNSNGRASSSERGWFGSGRADDDDDDDGDNDDGGWGGFSSGSDGDGADDGDDGDGDDGDGGDGDGDGDGGDD